MGWDTLKLVDLTWDDVQLAVRGALEPALDPRRLSHFLAQVDWSHQNRANQDVLKVLGYLDHLDTEYAEKWITREEFEQRLREVAQVKA